MLPPIWLHSGATRLTAMDLAIVALGVFAAGFYFVRRGRNTVPSGRGAATIVSAWTRFR